MNYRSALEFGTLQLKDLENPRLETEVILSQLLNMERIKFRTTPDNPLGFWQQRQFKRMIKQRRKHLPIAYIFGYKMWNDLKISVSKDTLIPRDETEALTQYIAQSYYPVAEKKGIKTSAQLKLERAPKQVLDIGTGSGCIAIWIKKTFQKSQVTALDCSSAALKIAANNAAKHNTNIRFIKSDLLEKIPSQAVFDLIVANLPYVPNKTNVSSEVQKEPSLALFSGPDGLDHIRRLEKEINDKKIIFNHLWLEFLPEQQSAITEIFSQYAVNFYPDVSGQIFFAEIRTF